VRYTGSRTAEEYGNVKAAEVIATPDRWCKGHLFQDKNGESWKLTGANDPACYKFCLRGAVMKAYGDEKAWAYDYDSKLPSSVLQLVGERIGVYVGDNWTRLVKFNNHPDTTHEEVLAVAQAIDDAIASGSM
jgi:hypothetical protein